MNRFAISQISTKPLTLAEDISFAEDNGVGLELVEGKFSKIPAILNRELSEISESNLSIVSIQGQVLTAFPTQAMPQPVDPQQRINRIKDTIRTFATYFPGRPIITNTGADGNSGNERKVWEECIGLYQELAVYAASLNMRLALEPLSPSLQNRSTIICSFSRAIELVEAVNHSSFGLCLDIYNVWESANLYADIDRVANRIFLVQVADWKLPRSFHDRHALGKGKIPISKIIKRLENAGYTGDYVLELFSEGFDGALWEDKKALKRELTDSINYFFNL